MFSRPDVLIESQVRAGLGGWRGTLLFAVAWTSLTPVVLWYFIHRLRMEPSREMVLVAWSLIAGIGIIGTRAVIGRTYFAVMPGELQIGRSPHETIIEFSEIETIVVGLPAQQSRLLRIGRFSHYSAPAYRRLAEVRRDTILLRLQNGYYVAWYISRSFITNADSLKTTLLQLNRSKVVGTDSYTLQEIKSLGNVYFNRVRMIAPGR